MASVTTVLNRLVEYGEAAGSSMRTEDVPGDGLQNCLRSFPRWVAKRLSLLT